MQPAPHWWENFFEGLIADSLRQMFPPAQTKAEADFLVKALQPQAGARILDVPCGTGRLSLELARRGYRLTGVDLSECLLEDARRGAEGESLPAEFEHRDMRDLPWSARFDHAFSFGNSFAYFDDAGNLAFLQAVNAALKPGGTFVLETALVAECAFPQLGGRRWFTFGDLYFLHDTVYDPETSRLTSTYVLIRDGQVERKQAVYRVYGYRELLELLGVAGFVEVKGYGSRQCEPFQLGSPSAWLVARRA
jgi:cyclopropane fatty-acyl-phospholipid synthase-like methyltransferase